MLNLSNRSSFHTLLDAIALHSEHDDHPAIIYLETDHAPITISRREFCEAVIAHAAGLQHMGIRPRDLVIIAHTQNLESIFAFWGALWCGAIPSMFPTLTEKLDPEIYMHSMAELARLSEVRAIFTTDEFEPQLAARVPCQVFGSEHLAKSVALANGGKHPERNEVESKDARSSTTSLQNSAHAVSAEPRRAGRNANEVAFLQHSSGTTGLQKGVALSHEAVLNQVASYSEAIALNDEDVIVSWLPLYHDMGLIAGFILPLVQGVPLVMMSPFDWVAHPALLLHAINDYRGTLCWLPNFAYNHCARRVRQRDSEGVSLASMRMFINCSEPVRYESHQMFLERFAANGVTSEMLAVSYAMAENTFAVTQTPIGQAARSDVVDRIELEQNRLAKPVAIDHPHAQIRVSCGTALRNTAAKIIDEAGNALPDRSVGQVALKSDCMLSEYYKRPDLQPFQDDWYRTGDMGYIADGELYIVGRLKDLIINAGKNIYPQDIEAIVNTVPGVYPGRAVAFGVPDEREGTELIGVVAEVTVGDPQERKHLATQIRNTVAKQSMVTVTYVHLVSERWLIKTSSGKIARAANREKWLGETQ
ncbi:MAG TPA: AMP-binding protein [Anaerolineae bacterium]|nr:AMP-binding protein [Anaerolineae bacterium]